MTNGHQESFKAGIAGIPQNSGFGDGAANAAAEANWDANNDLAQSQEWVQVPRNSAETDAGITATPAAPSNIQSWADDTPDTPEVRNPFSFVRQLIALLIEYVFVGMYTRLFANHRPPQQATTTTATTTTTPPVNPNDGFHEVQRNRGGNRGDGQGRGRGGRGRGRGEFRGDGRGRGRGGQRGGARGGRRPDES